MNLASSFRLNVKITILLMLISIPIQSQPRRLSNDECLTISIDKFDQLIYYRNGFREIKLLDPVTLKDTISTILRGIPAFARYSHMAAYNYNNDTYTYDFATGTTKKIIDRNDNTWFFITKEVFFSPNDSFLFINAAGERNLYNFNTNTYTILPPELLNSFYFEWLDDSTLIHSNNDVYPDSLPEIYSYNIFTQLQDTIFRGDEGDELFNFTTNKSDRILSFAKRYSNNENAKRIEAKFYQTSLDSILFDLDRDEPTSSCLTFPQIPNWQSWNEDGTKLAFILDSYFGQMGGIFVYELIKSKTVRYTECYFEDLKRDLDWLNDTTLIYNNATQRGIYEFRLNHTGINDDGGKTNDITLMIPGYPNPFNSEIVFEIKPELQMTQIRIFNTLGSEVRRIDISNQNQIRWDGKNNEGTGLTSGIYFILFSTPTKTQQVISKVLFLK